MRQERKKGTPMKSRIEINAIENSIIVSKAFYKRASAYGSNEYAALHNAMIENPTAKIVFKTIEKKTYKALTFKVMEDYIKTQSESDKLLIKFFAVQRIAKTKDSLYPLTKKWFLNTFPNYKVNAVNESETEKLTATLEAEAKSEVNALVSSHTNTLCKVA